jgi:beta-lactamase superfamily II metal-dependent hydrolase
LGATKTITFPEGSRIPPHGTFVWARDAEAFRALYGKDPDAEGMELRLNNDGDSLTLKNHKGKVIDYVAWGKANRAWEDLNPKDATIERVLDRDWDVASDWKGRNDLGRPGSFDPLPMIPWTKGRLEIHIIDVSQADATLIVGPKGRSMLIDAGETHFQSGKNALKIARYIYRVLGNKHISYAMISHYHLDHLGNAGELEERGEGGFRKLLEEEGVVIDEHMIERGFDNVGKTSKTYYNWKAWSESPQGQALLHSIYAEEGTHQIDLGKGVTVNIVAVDGNGQIPSGDLSGEPTPPSENDYSIALKISFGGFDYFTGGDLSGEDYESEWGYTYHDIETSVAPEVGDIEVLRLNHHGSSHSTNQFFIDTLNPEVCIISVGENTYGHPAQEVMDRLSEACEAIYMTGRGNPETTLGPDVIIIHEEAVIKDGVVVRVNKHGGYTVSNAVYSSK